MINLLDYDRRGLEEYFAGLGERPFRAVQLIRWLHREGIADLDAMTNLSKPLREQLKLAACIQPPEIINEQISADGTRKWQLRVDRHNSIEMVFIPEADRGTLCVSSQVGCALDCSFCSTGKQGFSRNLALGEIIGQIWQASRRLPPLGDRRAITNVVFMGMGEPLLNYDNVNRAIELMLDNNGYNLARRRVTVSTAGLVPQMDRLANESQASLAVSLHAPNDALRNELVPINRSYPLKELLAACRRFAEVRKGEPITFEYVMLDGVNDGPAEARELVRRLSGIPAKFNLIPFNRFPATGYRCSPLARINQFREILLHGGLVTVTRKTRGEDIDAACGQLAGKVLPRARRHQTSVLQGTDI